jgi:pilus assembly protein TadC
MAVAEISFMLAVMVLGLSLKSFCSVATRLLFPTGPYRRASIGMPASLRGLLSIKGRKLALDEELPYAMETLALSSLSGLGLLQSIELVGGMDDSVACLLFRQVAYDIASGVPRFEAFEKLSKRLNSAAGVSLVSTIRQAEVSGTPIGSILLAQAEAARRYASIERQRRIDLVPLWLVICTVLFLLPSVILSAIVPHILAFSRTGW